MSIELDCPLCDRQWKVRDDQVNRRTYCPGCDEEYYVPERLGARAGSGRSRDDDGDDEPAPRGLSRGALIGIGAGAGGFLLIAVIVTVVMLSRPSPTTTAPFAQSPTTTAAGPGPGQVGTRRELTRTVFHTIAPTSTRAKVEEMLGPGTPIAATEMRESLATDGCQTFCPPTTADKICASPVIGFYKWTKDRMSIYVAFNSKDATGVLVCAVYIGPDVPFKKVSQFKPNIFAMNALP
jgi:hypothetical protein